MKAMEEISVHEKLLMKDDGGDGNSILIENSIVGESKSNGVVENASKRLQGQIHILRLILEEIVGMNVDLDPNIWQWMIEFAIDKFNRRKVGQDELTPYERIKGRASAALIVAFFCGKTLGHVSNREAVAKS